MRRQISWLVLATTSAVVFSFVVPLGLLVRTLAHDRAMTAADEEARNAAVLVAGLTGDPRLPSLVATVDQRGPARTSVLLPGGRVLGADHDMAGDAEVARARRGSAFRVVDRQGGRVLVPVVGSRGTAVVRSAVTRAGLDRGVGRAWLFIGCLGLGLILLALLVARQLGARVSRPLIEVADVAHRLRAGELAARAQVRGTEETRELARALNGLADRTTELLATERAAVGDLSHRLRTPVTALRLDAESVADAGTSQRLSEHVAALQRTIDQIVKEARRPVLTDLAPRCEASRVVRARVDYWSALAEEQGRRVEVSVPTTPLPVPLAEGDLADVVDILLDNVFAHTPEGVGFGVTLVPHEDAVRLVVLDEGPAQVADPGGRPGSTGLGLDIVRRTARSVGGTSSFAHDLAGTQVEVTLPLARDPDLTST